MSAEYLDADRWLDLLAALASRASDSAANEQEQVLRTFFHLLRLAPLECQGKLCFDLREHELEALLKVSAFETATLKILGRSFGAMVSFPPGESEALASVWLPGEEGEKSGRGASASLALVASSCGALVDSCLTIADAKSSETIN